MLDGGNFTQIDHITLKSLESPSLPFGKIDGLPQGPATLSAVLKMTVQDDKLGFAANRQGPETTFEFPLHGQLIPSSTTSGTTAFFPFPDNVVVDGPSTIFGPQMLVADQAQGMIQIARRRHGLYPPSFDHANQKEDIPPWR